MSEITHDADHTGPIKTPKQLFWVSIGAFVIPVFVIIGLVMFVTSFNKLSPGASDTERGIAERLQKVGTVEIRDANRPLASGEDVYKAQCSACHATGVSGAPKFGDAGAWAARIAQGFDALLHSALAGKGAMPPQGGGNFSDVEIGRAVAYMANHGGAKFAEPAAPAASGASEAASAAGAADAHASAAEASAAAATVAASEAANSVAPAAAASVAETQAGIAATQASAAGSAAAGAGAAAAGGGQAATVGKALYDKTCFTCHGAGIAGAPKFGDKAAWAPYVATGLDTMLKVAISGKGAMPPRGGSTASDDELRAAIQYMVDAAH